MIPQMPVMENKQEREAPAVPPEKGYAPQYPPYQYAQYDERFIDELARRIEPGLRKSAVIATAGQRLALAIVSLALMIPLVAIVLSVPSITILGFWGTLFAIAAVCTTMIAINAIFSPQVSTPPAR